MAGVKPEQVDEVMMGCVIQAAQGQNVARQASIKAGLPRNHHMIMVECIGQSVVYHGIYDCRIVHTVSETGFGHCIRSHGHILHTAGYYDVSLSGHDDLGAIVIKEALNRAGVKPEQVDEVMMGCVIQAAQDFCWLFAENASNSSRAMPYLSHTFSAVIII